MQHKHVPKGTGSVEWVLHRQHYTTVKGGACSRAPSAHFKPRALSLQPPHNLSPSLPGQLLLTKATNLPQPRYPPALPVQGPLHTHVNSTRTSCCKWAAAHAATAIQAHTPQASLQTGFSQATATATLRFSNWAAPPAARLTQQQRVPPAATAPALQTLEASRCPGTRWPSGAGGPPAPGC